MTTKELIPVPARIIYAMKSEIAALDKRINAAVNKRSQLINALGHMKAIKPNSKGD